MCLVPEACSGLRLPEMTRDDGVARRTYDTPAAPDRVFCGDVWSSHDGASWVRHTARAPWAARQYHDVAAWGAPPPSSQFHTPNPVQGTDLDNYRLIESHPYEAPSLP